MTHSVHPRYTEVEMEIFKTDVSKTINIHKMWVMKQDMNHLRDQCLCISVKKKSTIYSRQRHLSSLWILRLA